MHHSRLLVWVCMIALLIVPLSSCRTPLSPKNAMEAFAKDYPLPCGTLYFSESPARDPSHPDDQLFSLLYASPDGSDDREDIMEYAIFLGASLTYACEAGIFLCPDSESASEVMGMLSSRIFFVSNTKETDTTFCKDAFVKRYGRQVVYAILPDNQKALRIWDKIL